MNRLEALEHFHKIYAEEVLRQKIHHVASLYEQRKEELIFSFIQSFQWICQQANHMEVSKARIGYTTYSMSVPIWWIEIITILSKPMIKAGSLILGHAKESMMQDGLSVFGENWWMN